MRNNNKTLWAEIKKAGSVFFSPDQMQTICKIYAEEFNKTPRQTTQFNRLAKMVDQLDKIYKE